MLRRSPALVVVAAVYAAALLAVAWWPTHVDDGVNVYGTLPGRWLLARGFDYPTTYTILEAGSNILLFVPAGALLLIVRPAWRWWHAVVAALVVSTSFELVQAVFLAGRTADVTDVVTNTLGAALGAGMVVAVRGLVRARSESR